MDGDTTFTKLFVGGLPWETRGDAVRRHFEQFGEIVEAVVIADKHTSRSQGLRFSTSTYVRINETDALLDLLPFDHESNDPLDVNGANVQVTAYLILWTHY
ncbi:hypothetical protein OsI_29272 [Oryza sativa Indica Group]|uniref:RRM domain-containing protein n=1 Tax=Oryza sativa subsp. indica TaxID=39946 RepID=B8BAU6_ORYSI|nr:hypothetical protein OsI_29272 [Oryza sativa Indica Group]